jgi:dynein heavy chain
MKIVPRLFKSQDGSKGRYGEKAIEKSFFEVISADEDILKILVNIMNGMSSSGSELHKVLSYWDKYRPLWEMDREAFVRRYAKQNKSLSQYEIDIQKYRDSQLDIQNEDVSDNINFIQIDYSDLKSKLISFAIDWQTRLTSLLNENARTMLEAFLQEMESATEQLTAQPFTFAFWSGLIDCLEGLEAKAADTESSFDPLEAMYASLAKFDV